MLNLVCFRFLRGSTRCSLSDFCKVYKFGGYSGQVILLFLLLFYFC